MGAGHPFPSRGRKTVSQPGPGNRFPAGPYFKFPRCRISVLGMCRGNRCREPVSQPGREIVSQAGPGNHFPAGAGKPFPSRAGRPIPSLAGKPFPCRGQEPISQPTLDVGFKDRHVPRHGLAVWTVYWALARLGPTSLGPGPFESVPDLAPREHRGPCGRVWHHDRFRRQPYWANLCSRRA